MVKWNAVMCNSVTMIWFFLMIRVNIIEMKLVINKIVQDKILPSSELFRIHKRYFDESASLLKVPATEVGPKGLLYLQQGEMAVVVKDDKNVSILGTDTPSIGIAMVLRHTGSGAVGLAHLDGEDTLNAVTHQLKRVKNLSTHLRGNLELQLIGGILDSSNSSENILREILDEFQRRSEHIHLTLACVCKLNTKETATGPVPIIYGVAVNVTSGKVFPATFKDKGPEFTLRFSRLLTDIIAAQNIYDSDIGLLKIGPFMNWPSMLILDYFNKSDSDIRSLAKPLDQDPNQSSQCPKCQEWIDQVRDSMNFIRKNPEPLDTLFPDGRPHYFKRNLTTGCWMPFQKPESEATVIPQSEATVRFQSEATVIPKSKATGLFSRVGACFGFKPSQ